MRTLVSLTLIAIAMIHLLPLAGVLGVGRLGALYGVSVTEPNLAILLRHRAVLFGLLGAFLLVAAWQPRLQPMAFVAGFVSVLSFMALASSTGGYNREMARVVAVDWAALACLVVGVLARWRVADAASAPV